MPCLHNHSIKLHYEVHGDGHPVVLLHGATVNFRYNYAELGWIQVLNDAGFQVIGLDFRGHGNSAKPHEAALYGTANLASDVISLLDHLKTERASLIGYSIGTVVALHLLQHSAARFDRAALVATGDGLIGHPPYTFSETLPKLAQVLERETYPNDLPKHLAAYWNFVAVTAGDKRALGALAQGSYPPVATAEAACIAVPTLVISGQNDMVLGCGPRLAQALNAGEYLEVAGADHFSLAADTSTMAAVAGFLKSAANQRSPST
jgi:pimeloyl-ACP methyl ester carboxylesterase